MIKYYGSIVLMPFLFILPSLFKVKEKFNANIVLTGIVYCKVSVSFMKTLIEADSNRALNMYFLIII